MSVIVRKYIPLLIVGVLGMFMIFSYPIDSKGLSNTASLFGVWTQILASFALGLGAINMILIHGKRMSKIGNKSIDEWVPSFCLLATLVGTTAIGIITGIDSSGYRLLYDILIGAGNLTLTSLRGFFMFTAFYRAFRGRTLEGIVMLLGCLLIMTYQVPIAELVFPQLNILTQWVLDVPFVGGNRSIAVIGVIAMVIMAFRLISGIDRTWMGASE